jgi:hypothetical protein
MRYRIAMYGPSTGSLTDRGAKRLAVWVALFWAFTYLLFTTRAQLAASDSAAWISSVRFVTISAGSLFFGLALWVVMQSSKSPSRLALLIVHIVGASLAVLAIRYVVDRAWADAPATIAQHVRWVLVWAGYFGLWLGAFLEMNRRQAVAIRASMVDFAPASAAQGARLRASEETLRTSEQSTADAWEWIVDTLADELSKQEPPARAALIKSLQHRAGYEISEDVTAAAPSHNARVQLVELLARKSRAGHAPRRPH